MSSTTSDAMTKEQEAQALVKIRDNKIRQASTADYVQEVKQSMLFRPGFDWNSLLSAAPVSVSLLASLFVASTIPDALQIKIIAPDGGFKHLSNFDKPSLNSCLIQCSDKGSKAFGVAASSFDAIALKSATIKKTINQIIELLGDPDSAETLLVPTMMNLKETSSDASEKQAANQIQLAAKQTQLGSAEEAKTMASESLKTLKGSLEVATSAYKKAADEFPSGWDLVAQQFVSNLTDSFTTAINLAVPALIENYSMTAKLEKGVNIFKGGNGGAEGGSVGDGKTNHDNVQPVTNAPPATAPAVPPFPNDPAYGVIGGIQSYILTIQSFITGGPNNGVDWDLLQSKNPNKQNHGLGVMVALLDDARNSFKPSKNSPSETLVDIFAKVKQVTDGLQKALDAHKTINGKELPKADSAEVQEWQLVMNKEAIRAVRLDTDSKNLNGASSPPSVNPPQAQSSPTDKSGAFRKQIIDAATTKLNKTAEVMQTVTENYQKASDKLVDVQLKIGVIQGELAALNASNINLDKIKSILIKCIDILVQLKSQISKLVAFFSAVSTLVEHVVDDQVQPFITYLKSATNMEKPEATILNFTMTDFMRQMIFSYCLNIRAYFELFRDIALLYGDVNVQFISPGLELVNSMQTEYNANGSDDVKNKILEEKTRKVSEYTKSSVAGVKLLVGKRQEEISRNLEANAQRSAKELEFVPVRPPVAVTQAITASTDTAKKAAASGIEESSKYLTRTVSSTASLIDNS
ncbi:hypothetical protein LZ32DRAFT_695625 [Colletotrichum eremochloae]|nr:hypothetical protein LZ32DRAFT_695625 [Colletotrichum eremochloae]